MSLCALGSEEAPHKAQHKGARSASAIVPSAKRNRRLRWPPISISDCKAMVNGCGLRYAHLTHATRRHHHLRSAARHRRRNNAGPMQMVPSNAGRLERWLAHCMRAQHYRFRPSDWPRWEHYTNRDPIHTMKRKHRSCVCFHRRKRRLPRKTTRCKPGQHGSCIRMGASAPLKPFPDSTWPRRAACFPSVGYRRPAYLAADCA